MITADVSDYNRKIAEHSSRLKSEFLARMSHEMLTPMNAIIGYIEIAKTSDEVDQIMSCIDKINDSAIHLLAMLHNILDVSDGSSAFSIHEAGFAIKALVRYVLSKTNPARKKKNQEFSLFISESIPKMLIGDEKRIAQVIVHLIINAIKFSPKKGKVSLKIDIFDKESEVITLRIEVADNGIGISGEQQEVLFNLFEQVDGSKKRKYEGIGIGLPLSKCIARMMDGDIEVESEPGKGSKFIFTCKLKRVY